MKRWLQGIALVSAASGGVMVSWAWVPRLPAHSSHRVTTSGRSIRPLADDVPTCFLSSKNHDVTTSILPDNETTLPNIVSPVLQQCYKDMLEYNATYGHPNIPLPAGRPLVTLRRLYAQGKLVPSDVDLLNDLQFIWHSLEDVYTENKDRFDDFLQRLILYADQHDGDLSPPKKYPADPELGAWVTGLRRLHVVHAVDPAHRATLDALGFQWKSPRQCGSQFMQQYREIQERLTRDESPDVVWRDAKVVAWVQAQQRKASELSGTRQHYMAQLLFGTSSSSTNNTESWLTWEPPTTGL